MIKKHVLKQTPVEVKIVKSGPHFWHRDFIGKIMPIKKIIATDCGLYFHVNPGCDRPKGSMEGMPWGISGALCKVIRWEQKETIINEERTGL